MKTGFKTIIFSYQWIIFAIFTLIHLIANYLAVSTLIFTHLNNTRLILLLRTYLKFNSVCNPDNLSKHEPVIVGFGPKSILTLVDFYKFYFSLF